jgi:hypothetical protein
MADAGWSAKSSSKPINDEGPGGRTFPGKYRNQSSTFPLRYGAASKFMACAKLRRRDAVAPTEPTGKVVGVAETCAFSNLRDRPCCHTQQRGYPGKLRVLDVGVLRHRHLLADQDREARAGGADLSTERVQGERLARRSAMSMAPRQLHSSPSRSPSNQGAGAGRRHPEGVDHRRLD